MAWGLKVLFCNWKAGKRSQRTMDCPPPNTPWSNPGSAQKLRSSSAGSCCSRPSSRWARPSPWPTTRSRCGRTRTCERPLQPSVCATAPAKKAYLLRLKQTRSAAQQRSVLLRQKRAAERASEKKAYLLRRKQTRSASATRECPSAAEAGCVARGLSRLSARSHMPPQPLAHALAPTH
jgi:hypothetical protein